MKAQTQWAFRIRAEADSLDIDIYDVVGDSWFGGVTAKDVREQLKNAAVSQINVRINSGGGDVWDGVAIYNLLREHKAQVHVEVDGLAASIASIIAMAGDRIRIASNAMLMIHDPWTFTWGGSEQLRKDADMLDKVRDTLASTYVARTRQPLAQVLEWMAAETWMTADEAKERGFVDEVAEAKQVAASAYDLSGFRNVPRQFIERLAQTKTPAPGAADKEKTTMDNEQLKAQLKAAQDELARANETHASVVKAKDATIDALTRELVGDGTEKNPGLRKRCADAESKLIETEVDALVGVKITAAEAPAYKALARSDRKSFDELVAARPELGLIGERKAKDPNAPPRADSDIDTSDELSTAAERYADEAN